jgi:hypothetical protein
LRNRRRGADLNAAPLEHAGEIGAEKRDERDSRHAKGRANQPGSADRACGTKRDVAISMSQTPAYRLKNAQNGYHQEK